ncbi:MAG: aminoacyl-tRNA hydrolase [Candidatus Acidiferrales bacterium]
MRLIVGLGNPGPEYIWTPHNLGFGVIDVLAGRTGIRVTRPESQSYVGLGAIAGHEVALAKPQTYMNASGRAVRDLMERYSCDPEELIVAYDEVDLPWGMILIKERGSAGTHNGMKSVVGALASDEFLRVRLGIKPEHPVPNLAAYVLAPMGRDIRESAAGIVGEAADAIEMILSEGASRAMTRYNRRAASAEESEA